MAIALLYDTLSSAQRTSNAGRRTAHRQLSEGNAGAKRLAGGHGNDRMFGGAGINVIDGGCGNDSLVGDAGDDYLVGGEGNDTIVGGAGADTASYAGALSAVRVDLGLAAAQNTLGAGVDKLSEIENLVGSNFADRLSGDAFSNAITGGAGADTLYGKGGSDRLVGGNGIDNLYGGEGADTFVLLPTSIDQDIVRDFELGLDHVEISASLFGVGLPAGVLSDDRFAANSGGLAQDTDDRFVNNTSNGKLYFDANGSASGERTLIATFNGAPQLTVGDFRASHRFAGRHCQRKLVS